MWEQASDGCWGSCHQQPDHALVLNPHPWPLGRTAGKSWASKQSGEITCDTQAGTNKGLWSCAPEAALGATAGNISLQLTKWWEGYWDGRQRTATGLSHRDSLSLIKHGAVFHFSASWCPAVGHGPAANASTWFVLIRAVAHCLSTVICFYSFPSL